MSFATFLVDDDKGVLNALSRLLRTGGYEAQAYTSPEHFLAEYDASVAGCVILDLTLPGIDGLQLQRRIAEQDPGRPVIFLTGTGDIPQSVLAMKAGAVDFLTKPVDRAQLFDAVERARERDMNARNVKRDRQSFECRLARLTPREREVLDHVVIGQLNKQIAHALGTVEKTIKVHRGRLMTKLEVRSVAELVRLTERAGLHPAA
jgi:FixJ family two-component response regulator